MKSGASMWLLQDAYTFFVKTNNEPARTIWNPGFFKGFSHIVNDFVSESFFQDLLEIRKLIPLLRKERRGTLLPGRLLLLGSNDREELRFLYELLV